MPDYNRIINNIIPIVVAFPMKIEMFLTVLEKYLPNT